MSGASEDPAPGRDVAPFLTLEVRLELYTLAGLKLRSGGQELPEPTEHDADPREWIVEVAAMAIEEGHADSLLHFVRWVQRHVKPAEYARSVMRAVREGVVRGALLSAPPPRATVDPALAILARHTICLSSPDAWVDYLTASLAEWDELDALTALMLGLDLHQHGLHRHAVRIWRLPRGFGLRDDA